MKKIFALIIANPQVSVVLGFVAALTVGTVIGVGIWYWAFHQTDSKNEIKADDARVGTIEAQANANVAEQPVVEAKKASKEAAKQVTAANQDVKAAKKRSQAAAANVEKAKQPVKGVSYGDAKKAQCLAFPEDCK